MVTQDIEIVVTRTRTGIPIVSFVGRSGSGKTTLLEKVVRELKGRGYRVATVKHAPHGFDIDHPGKDSWRFSQAGSDIVILSSSARICLLENSAAEVTLGQIEALVGDRADIVLVEGYKTSAYTKVLVMDDKRGAPHVDEARCLTTISPKRPLDGLTDYDGGDVASITTLLTNEIERRFPVGLEEVSKANGLISESDNGIYDFEGLLAEAAAMHGHVCPGQVLGVRMAISGCRELGIKKPRAEHKRLIVYVEIDRCVTDAIQVVTGCKLGKRTLKHMDYGKLAATFVDMHTGRAVRVASREDARQKASLYAMVGATEEESRISAYKAMADEELFSVEPVLVHIPDEDLPGLPVRRVVCTQCGEGVNDGRELIVSGKTLCRSCACGGYWKPLRRAD